ncbi:MAG: hypothetical protein HC875_15290 [Anaerolineales bacterium]|nr:hypothetical protein [Anaerolineales bacterium]
MNPLKRRLKKQIKDEMRKIAQNLGLENFIFDNNPKNVVYQMWKNGQNETEVPAVPQPPLKNAFKELESLPGSLSTIAPQEELDKISDEPDEQLEGSDEKEEDKIEIENENFSLPQKKKGGRPRKTETKTNE